MKHGLARPLPRVLHGVAILYVGLQRTSDDDDLAGREQHKVNPQATDLAARGVNSALHLVEYRRHQVGHRVIERVLDRQIAMSLVDDGGQRLDLQDLLNFLHIVGVAAASCGLCVAKQPGCRVKGRPGTAEDSGHELPGSRRAVLAHGGLYPHRIVMEAGERLDALGQEVLRCAVIEQVKERDEPEHEVRCDHGGNHGRNR
mmetsp:Transcript_31712/g.91344  ORF Transcript_31712/g.91344 Transcript_31712/m.91344 type:complete len:201 (-) Transcript_31712:1226-1828(-)